MGRRLNRWIIIRRKSIREWIKSKIIIKPNYKIRSKRLTSITMWIRKIAIATRFIRNVRLIRKYSCVISIIFTNNNIYNTKY
jgi:hypothetical protein